MESSAKPVILLVEDDDNDAFLQRRALAKIAIPVTLERALDAAQAMDYLTGPGPDGAQRPLPALVLCDVHLPSGDGLTFLTWLRGTKRFQKIPVIVITGSNVRTDWQTALSLGASGFIYKDSLVDEPERFARTVEECLIENGKRE